MIITHDLGVIAEMADDVLVMYAGRRSSTAPARRSSPTREMPYTWGLLSSVPDVKGDTTARLIPIPGNPPSLLSPPPGCSVQPPLRAPPQGAGRPLPHRAADCSWQATAAGTHQALSPADPEQIYASEVLPVIAPDLGRKA